MNKLLRVCDLLKQTASRAGDVNETDISDHLLKALTHSGDLLLRAAQSPLIEQLHHCARWLCLVRRFPKKSETCETCDAFQRFHLLFLVANEVKARAQLIAAIEPL
jgi:hypothetical protein